MKFDALDQMMRIYETSADFCVLPGMFMVMVARLDGRSFTRLTKEVHAFEAPFDTGFRDLMVQTAESLMCCGFRVTYAYTESDEISLLFARDEQHFGRKLRKYNSILAGEASARFSMLLGSVATYDCRISQLPSFDLVRDYFRWRNEDAARNALNAYCYWTLRKRGLDEYAATKRNLGLSIDRRINNCLHNGPIDSRRSTSWKPVLRHLLMLRSLLPIRGFASGLRSKSFLRMKSSANSEFKLSGQQRARRHSGLAVHCQTPQRVDPNGHVHESPAPSLNPTESLEHVSFHAAPPEVRPVHRA
jgi:tRNA(His) guanylyltransferase